jgi:hypothetical protein
MGNASTSVASGSCRYLTAGVTVASAGILALSPVAVLPNPLRSHRRLLIRRQEMAPRAVTHRMATPANPKWVELT